MAHRFQRFVVVAAGWLSAFAASGQDVVVVQGFEAAEAFNLVKSEGVTLRAAVEPGVTGNALRVDYEFVAGGGFGIVQFPATVVLPAPEAGDFEFAFKVRGEGTPNALEFKLLDVGGDLALNAEKADVWWVNRRDFVPPKEWTTLRQKRRHVTFAWGPKGGPAPTRVDKIEFAIASVNGGKGTLWFDDLTFRTIAPPPSPLPEAKVMVSVGGASAAPAAFPIAIAGGGAPTEVTIDFGYERDLDYLCTTFAGPALDAGVSTEVLAAAAGGPSSVVAKYGVRQAKIQDCILPETSATSVTLRLRTSGPEAASLVSVEVPEAGLGSDMNRLAKRWAAASPEGYPKYLRDQQTYWTVVGLPGSPNEVLVSDTGAVEIGDRAYTIEPMFHLNWREDLSVYKVIHTPNSSMQPTTTPTLAADGAVTITSVIGLQKLITTVRVVATPEGESAVITYTATNSSQSPGGMFGIRVRPFQVSPPWQFLNMTSGVGSIRSVRRTERGVLINEESELTVDPALPHASLDSFETHNWYSPPRRPLSLMRPNTTVGTKVDCPRAMASAYAGVELLPDSSSPQNLTWTVTCPLPRKSQAFQSNLIPRPQVVPAIQVPAAQQPLLDTLNANINYILVNADGPAIQPGSRCYERSWIRDGSLTSNALLAFGHAQQAVDFIDWYAKFLIPIGDDALKAPCVVDKRGADPVPENDSHGQYVFAVWNAYQFTKDISILERHWPNVQKVLRYIDMLTAERTTKDFGPDGPPRQEPGKPPVPAWAFMGLMPESISHEGYSAKPMHSYWDDWFTLRGLNDAARIAEALGHFDEAKALSHRAILFRGHLTNSIALTMDAHNIDYIPGCVELGDFDSTSTTIALWPGHALDTTGQREELVSTFDQYWEFFQKRAATNEWVAYTPYELRHVGVYVRLGQPDRAEAVLNWLMQHQRPQGWRQWAEVVWNDPATPKFIGDMPHTWCGSDFINSFQAMLAYESDDDTAIHLFAGLTPAWFQTPEPTRVVNLPTHFGPLTAEIKSEALATGRRVMCTIEAGCTPPKGFIVRAPSLDGRLVSINVNGKPIALPSEGVVTVPAGKSTIDWVFTDR